MSAAAELVSTVPVRRALRALGAAPATWYRRRTPRPPHPPARQRVPPLALSAPQRQRIVEVLTSPRFADVTPCTAWARLLDEDGLYLASVRTFYRVLAAEALVQQRRNQLVHPAHIKPELQATAPNQVWTWNITRLRSTMKGQFFYLYVLLDIFSRYVVGWLVAGAESAALAQALIEQTCAKCSIAPNTLTLHSDRGSQMRAKTTAELLVDLGVAASLSRPRVSNDNPFSEAQFKTLKYRPEFPERFAGIEHARAHLRRFFTWVQRRAPAQRDRLHDPGGRALRSRQRNRRSSRAAGGLRCASRALQGTTADAAGIARDRRHQPTQGPIHADHR